MTVMEFVASSAEPLLEAPTLGPPPRSEQLVDRMREAHSGGADLAEAHAEQLQLLLLDERDRIAVDLHHLVIRRLFATGLTLQAVAGSLGSGPAADRVLDAIGELDATISQIRATIFALHQSGPIHESTDGATPR